MTSTKKPWPCQLRTVERGRADDKADYQPPVMHVGADGERMVTLTLHNRYGEENEYSDNPTMQITLVGGDNSARIEAGLLEALDAVRNGRIRR